MKVDSIFSASGALVEKGIRKGQEKFTGERITFAEITRDRQQDCVRNQQAVKGIEMLNRTMETYNTEIKHIMHEKSGEYIVKVINKNDNTVIREIPSEKVLDIVAHFKKMLGFVLDKYI